MNTQSNAKQSCPLSLPGDETILLAHGSGGRLMNELLLDQIQDVYPQRPCYFHDSSVFACNNARLAMSTDSYVVHPLFFPGSDIGKLAVYGTINDLAMSGAVPRFLSLGLILEEGLAKATLNRVLLSIRQALQECEVELLTGDTKVVERGRADGLYINTTGIGSVADGLNIHPKRIAEWDVILLSGDIGRHGVAVMNARLLENSLKLSIGSDCAPLHQTVAALVAAEIDVHCLRDLTRGGLAAALGELCQASGLAARLSEATIPIHPEVNAYCELLGLEAYHLANEGRMVCIVAETAANAALEILRHGPGGESAAIIGHFEKRPRPLLSLCSDYGSERLLPMASGELLPRIC